MRGDSKVKTEIVDKYFEKLYCEDSCKYFGILWAKLNYSMTR